MGEKEKEKKEELELYRIFNVKVDEENKEFYVVNSVFFGVISLLLASLINEIIYIKNIENEVGDIKLLILISVFIVFLAFFWRRAIAGQRLWKNFWTNKLINIEEYIENSEKDSIWTYLLKQRTGETKSEMWRKFEQDCKEEEKKCMIQTLLLDWPRIFQDFLFGSDKLGLNKEGKGIWQELKKIYKKKDEKKGIGFGVTKYIEYLPTLYISFIIIFWILKLLR